VLLTACIAAPARQPLLQECVDSVRVVADEILLAEPTGARKAVRGGVRRLEFDADTWLDQDAVFDAVVSQAHGDWMLFVKGHERLDANAGDLRAKISLAGCDAFSLLVRGLRYRLGPRHRCVATEHPLAHGAISAVDLQSVRLFRRGKGYRFGGRLDPCVEPSLRDRGAAVRAGPWTIFEHTGLVVQTPERAEVRLARARSLVARRPTDPDVWLDLGRCLMEETEMPAAARECFREAGRLQPAADAWLEAALAFVSERRFDKALDLLDQAARCPVAAEDRWSEQDIAETRGEMLRLVRRGEEAAQVYENLLAVSPDRPIARMGLVEVLCGLSRSREAELHADWLRQRYPGLAQTWIATALVHLSQGQLLSAIESLKVALDIEPCSAFARYNLTIAYARLGAHRSAAAAFQRVCEVRGGVPLVRDLEVEAVSTPAIDLQRLGDEGVVSFIPLLAGGAGRVAVDIIRCLAPTYRQALITYDRSDLAGMGLMRELAELGVPVVSIGSGSQLPPLQRLLDPAVVLFHSGPPESPTPFAGTESVLVSVSHGRTTILPSNHDRYVCLSASHRRDHAYLPGELVTIIPNGVDLERFENADPDRRYWGKLQGANTVRIAMLTRLDPEKCVRRLLHYLEPLHGLDVSVAIAGHGARRWEIQPELARFEIGPKIHFTGPIPSRAVASFLAAADIGLHLTETAHETLSISILEMLAAGLPIVAQPRGCLPELVNDGVNGLLAEGEAEVASALRKLVLSKRLRTAMGTASREQAKAYAMSRFDAAWRTVVEQCVAEQRRRRAARPQPKEAGNISPSGASALVERLCSKPSPGRPPSYLIATTQRTGGTLLCAALNATGIAGYPREDVARWTFGLRAKRWRYPNLDDYLLARWRLGASPWGIYGVRLMFEHFTTLCNSFGTLDWPSRWLDQLGRPCWIFLRRHDRLAQAISLYKAESTGLWWDVGDPKVGVRQTAYDRTAIEACLQRLENADRAWQAFFSEHGLKPLELTYEDLAEDLETAVRKIVRELGAELSQPFDCPRAMRRQADDQTSAWMARFTRGD
jgi:LPS sulfotransferase NodH/glycosyltransferase involved in cell wall biosynthesis